MMVTHSLQLIPHATRAYKMENSSLQVIEKATNPAREIYCVK
jgi:hypothetical protein